MEVVAAGEEPNPLRYSGEYWDEETQTYYLRARYYDPVYGRFTQQDTHWSPANSIYGDKPQVIAAQEDPLGLHTYTYSPQIAAINQSGNLYVYCLNNPIAYVDPTGAVVETVFDLVTLGFSIAEVAVNPYDVTAWIGLAGDMIDIIPFVTGVGETVKGVRLIDKAGNTFKIAKATDFTDDAAEKIREIDRINGITKTDRFTGGAIHRGYKKGAGFSTRYKEFNEVEGIRPDYYDEKQNIIYELKPLNPRAAKVAVKQLNKYNQMLGSNNLLRLDFY